VKPRSQAATPTGPRLRAAGRAGVPFDTSKVDITMAGIHVLSAASRSTSTSAPPAIACSRPRPIVMDLHAGRESARY